METRNREKEIKKEKKKEKRKALWCKINMGFQTQRVLSKGEVRWNTKMWVVFGAATACSAFCLLNECVVFAY